jgi:hypothetical protein
MKVNLLCAGAFMGLCAHGQASGATVEEAMVEARSLVGQGSSAVKTQEDRFIGLALDVAGGCPATVAGDTDATSRNERKRIIDALVSAVAESGSRRGLTKLLRLASCGAESASWNRERILERAMGRMIADVPCLPPLSGEVSREHDNLADFPVLRLRDGHLRADPPTRAELDDLAYFMVAVSEAGDEIGARGAPSPPDGKSLSSARHDELFGGLLSAKSGGNVVDIERAARTYVEELGFPGPIHGDVLVAGAPRYAMALRDLAESWEALGRFHDAAGVWRRQSSVLVAAQDHAWEEQVKSVIRDEESDGRCDVAVAERLLDVDGELYGTRRLSDAKFDVARLLRGALLTINRDSGEAAIQSAIAAWSDTSRLLAQIRLRDKGVEDWERRLQAARGLADVMQERAIPLLLKAAADALPSGRQRAISALGDLALRPAFDPCRSPVALPAGSVSTWTRPLRPLGLLCDANRSEGLRRRLVAQVGAYARDANPGTREAVAVALGKIGIPAARPMLRQMLSDGELHGAARTALDNIDELERNWRTTK